MFKNKKICRYYKQKVRHSARASKHIRNGDTVMIHTGDLKKNVGKVIRVINQHVLIDNAFRLINNNKGQTIKVYRKIHSSNVSHFNEQTNTHSKIKIVKENNKNVKYYKTGLNLVPINYIITKSKNKDNKESVDNNLEQEDNNPEGISNDNQKFDDSNEDSNSDKNNN